MFCPKCGESLPDDAKFCAKCGHTITQSSETGDSQPSSSADQAVQTVASEAAASTPSNVASKPKAKKYLIIGIVAAVAVIAAIVIALNVTGAFTKGQSAETFKAQFEKANIVQSGIASNQYLNDSAYKLTNYSCNDIQVSKDPTFGVDVVTARIDATIENDNYVTDAQITGTYMDTKGTASEKYVGAVSNYSFRVESSETTPKKGIDYDSNLKLENCESVLSDDKMSCSVQQSEKDSFWFGDSSIDSNYTFTFDGNKWVEPKETDPIHTVVYKNIEGNYAAKTGDLTNFSKFTVSNLDATKGTFVIDYDYAKGKTLADNGGQASGTMTATIEPKPSTYTSYGMNDGYMYYFEAKGTSSSGDGQANLKGYLINSDSGEDTIRVESMAIDYSGTYKFTTRFTGYGPMFKQV